MAGPDVIVSPMPLPDERNRPQVYLGGSIDMGSAVDWQAEVIAALQDVEVVILNPRRSDWSPEWLPDAGEPRFREQVEWELDALERADVIVLYLASGSKGPISLLELGLHARSGKVLLHCADDYWRKGNVRITAERYGIEEVGSIDHLVAAIRLRL